MNVLARIEHTLALDTDRVGSTAHAMARVGDADAIVAEAAFGTREDGATGDAGTLAAEFVGLIADHLPTGIADALPLNTNQTAWASAAVAARIDTLAVLADGSWGACHALAEIMAALTDTEHSWSAVLIATRLRYANAVDTAFVLVITHATALLATGTERTDRTELAMRAQVNLTVTVVVHTVTDLEARHTAHDADLAFINLAIAVVVFPVTELLRGHAARADALLIDQTVTVVVDTIADLRAGNTCVGAVFVDSTVAVVVETVADVFVHDRLEPGLANVQLSVEVNAAQHERDALAVTATAAALSFGVEPLRTQPLSVEFTIVVQLDGVDLTLGEQEGTEVGREGDAVEQDVDASTVGIDGHPGGVE
jgi:hypothetical protein